MIPPISDEELRVQESIQDSYTSENAIRTYTSRYGLNEIESYLIDLYLPTTFSILDLACGGGRTTIPLHERGNRVTGIDSSPALMNVAKKRFPYIRFELGDFCNLQYEKNFFDSVLILHNGLDYAYPADRRRTALQECVRVLKDNGIFIFSSHNIESLILSPYYLIHPRRALWMLKHTLKAFRNYTYLMDLNRITTYFGSMAQVQRDCESEGLALIDIVGFRRSRNYFFNRFCSPYIHFVFRKIALENKWKSVATV